MPAGAVAPAVEPSLGGEVPAGEFGGDAPVGGETPTTGGATTGDYITVDNHAYTMDELRDAIKSHANRGEWEPRLKQQEMSVSKASRFVKGLESMWNKPVDQWGPRELQSMQMWNGLSWRLDNEQGFAQRLEAALTEINKSRGMTDAAARRTAAGQIEDIAAGPDGATPKSGTDPALMQRLDRIEQSNAKLMQSINEGQTQRTNTAVQNHMWGGIDQSLAKYSKDYPEAADEIVEGVISGMLADGWNDEKCLTAARAGTLRQEIDKRVYMKTKQIQARYDAWAARKAEALAKGRSKGVTAPVGGGGAGQSAPTFVPKPGEGISGMHGAAARKLGAGNTAPV